MMRAADDADAIAARLRGPLERPGREELRQLLDYAPETGDLRRKIAAPGSPAGELAGWITEEGYRRVMVRGRSHMATTLIWVMMTGEWPDRLVEHRDTYGPKADWGNRWENLRLATTSQNAQNQRRRSDNTSGHTGVSPFGRKWRASLRISGKDIYLGLFETRTEALAARLEAERRHFGDFAPVRPAGVA